MSKDYTQIDWAMDNRARAEWAEQEERLMDRIDYWETRRKHKKKRRTGR